MVTTVCFVDNVEESFNEVHRILRLGGYFIVAFVDRNSQLGKFYVEHKNESVFYNQAEFYSVSEVINHLKKANFKEFEFVQTIFRNPNDMSDIEPVKMGYGNGSFVVIKAKK
jgi:SAM-dependent methyltransferase